MIDTNKYRIEPRAKGYRNYNTSCWLVVIDKNTEQVLCDPRSPRAHMKFSDIDEIEEYLKKLETK